MSPNKLRESFYCKFCCKLVRVSEAKKHFATKGHMRKIGLLPETAIRRIHRIHPVAS